MKIVASSNSIQAKTRVQGTYKGQFWGIRSQKIKDSLKALRHDESSKVALKTIQTPSWQTDLNHPFITKVKEVITSEKSTTIVMEYER